jgi:integrase
MYHGKVVIRLAMKLMALTFVRTSELIATPRSEINFEESRWDLPKERMKMPALHIVPLSAQAIEELASTILHEQAYPHEHIELQLAHMPRDPVSAAYNHVRYLKPTGEDDAGLGGLSGTDAARRQGHSLCRLIPAHNF